MAVLMVAVWCALFAALGAVGTWVARAYALRRNLLDAPGERRSHVVPTPRGAGVAIVLAMLVALAALLARLPHEVVLLGCTTVGLVLVALIGWIDDHRPLSPWSRLAVHVLAAGWLAAGFWLTGSTGATALLVFAAAVVLVNAWNFMDGIDAIAAGQAVVVVAALVLLAPQGLPVFLGLACIAATLGFLPFNLPRARAFLGDVGSGSLGYLVAVFAGLAMRGAPSAAWLLVLLPLAPFLVDTGLTLATRMLRGERWWEPHVTHAYQCAARRFSHGPVAIAYAVWAALGGALAAWIAAGGPGKEGTSMLVLGWITLTTLAWYAARRSAPAAADGARA